MPKKSCGMNAIFLAFAFCVVGVTASSCFDQRPHPCPNGTVSKKWPYPLTDYGYSKDAGSLPPPVTTNVVRYYCAPATPAPPSRKR